MRTSTLIKKLNRIESDADSAADASFSVQCLAFGGTGGYFGAWAMGGSLVTGVGSGLIVGTVIATLFSCCHLARKKTPEFETVNDTEQVVIEIRGNNP